MSKGLDRSVKRKIHGGARIYQDVKGVGQISQERNSWRSEEVGGGARSKRRSERIFVHYYLHIYVHISYREHLQYCQRWQSAAVVAAKGYPNFKLIFLI
jgi:hypothetical protein